MFIEGPRFLHKAPLIFLSSILTFAKAWLSHPLPMQIRIGDQMRRLLPHLQFRKCSRSDEKA
jgi:hypothetical protein